MMLQREDIRVYQGSVNKAPTKLTHSNQPFLAEIIKVYSERCTCDIRTFEGITLPNIPVLTKAGVVDGEVYGEIDLPNVHDIVVITYVGGSSSLKVIDRTVIPYMTTEFSGDAVNSSGKQFTKKLLEANKPNNYKKILKSGTTIEVDSAGSVYIETPSGAFIKMDNASGTVTINDNLEILL